MRYFSPLAAAVLVLSPVVAPAADPVSGWRGNQTGLWPDAKPPREWHRIPRSALDGLRASAAPPKGKDHGDALLVPKGLVRDWLVISPFAVENSEKDFDRDALGGEATAEPAEGKKVGEVAWFRISPAAAVAAVLLATSNAAPNWGVAQARNDCSR